MPRFQCVRACQRLSVYHPALSVGIFSVRSLSRRQQCDAKPQRLAAGFSIYFHGMWNSVCWWCSSAAATAFGGEDVLEANIRHSINLESVSVVIRGCHGTRHVGTSPPSRALRISCAAAPCAATCIEMASAEGAFGSDSGIAWGLMSLSLFPDCLRMPSLWLAETMAGLTGAGHASTDFAS